MKKLKKLIQKLFIIYLVAGGALLVMDAIDKKLNPPPFRISFSAPEYESFTLNEEWMEKVREEIEKFVSVKRAKWFLPPSYGDCAFYISRRGEGILYRLCKDEEKKGRWWIIREGSYKGRSTDNFYELKEEEAMELLKKVREIAEKGEGDGTPN